MRSSRAAWFQILLVAWLLYLIDEIHYFRAVAKIQAMDDSNDVKESLLDPEMIENETGRFTETRLIWY